ncbi:ubiquinone anaerobic biosynthesis accessory factor UbiT [Motiliproteus coralliicola]|nr:SCP2 sterol-binding domain-containing protein [Motiliproteus coralliicola]
MIKLPTLPLPNFPISQLPFSALPISAPKPALPAELLKKVSVKAMQQAGKIPFPVQRKVMLNLMEQAFAEPLEDGDFEFLEGKWLKVEISDLQLRWFFSYSEEDGLIASPDEIEDAGIRGNLKEFVLLATRSEDPDSLFFQRRLMIEGDTEVGLEVKNLMDSVDQDSLPPMIKLILNKGAPLLSKLL